MNTVVVMKRMKTAEMTESLGNYSTPSLSKHDNSITCVQNSFKILSLNHQYLVISSILNVPGESTLRRDFQRLQQENKERSEAHKRQQAQLAAQRRDPEEHKRQLLHDRQKRIEEQKEQRRRLEEV